MLGEIDFRPDLELAVGSGKALDQRVQVQTTVGGPAPSSCDEACAHYSSHSAGVCAHRRTARHRRRDPRAASTTRFGGVAALKGYSAAADRGLPGGFGGQANGVPHHGGRLVGPRASRRPWSPSTSGGRRRRRLAPRRPRSPRRVAVLLVGLWRRARPAPASAPAARQMTVAWPAAVTPRCACGSACCC